MIVVFSDVENAYTLRFCCVYLLLLFAGSTQLQAFHHSGSLAPVFAFTLGTKIFGTSVKAAAFCLAYNVILG